MSFATADQDGIAGLEDAERPRHLATRRSRFSRGFIATVPIVVVSSIALSLNFGSSAHASTPVKRADKAKTGLGNLDHTPRSIRAAVNLEKASAPSIPARYTVVAGDSVSGIAARFGLSTASVLAINGLSWKSLIFPGQSLILSESAVSRSADEGSVASDMVRYSIVAGDTVSAVAARFNVSTQAVLAANGLGASSLIFVGQVITIPGSNGAGPTSAAPAPTAARPSDSTATDITPLNAEMRGNAATIIAVGRREGVGDYGIVIALSAAMQESSLRNLNGGHLDSFGLFQQRPSAGWGSHAQIMDPVRSTEAFFGGANNPNSGRTRGLLDIAGWQSMSVTQAAQAVQLSAYPVAYAKWEASARVWLSQLG